MAEETVERLARMRRAMVKLHRQGRVREFEAVAAAYAALKAELVERVHEEQRAAARARVAARRAEQEEREPSGRWRLPPGFSSPLAARRAREGWRPRVAPSAPAGGLRPWRSGSPMQERVWRP